MSKPVVKLENGKKSTVLTERKAVAYIDGNHCINCGKCRQICPVEAIDEYQKPICRLCPDCGEGPQMFPSEADAFATKHSCSIGCPLGTVPEGYVNLIKEGRIEDAYDLIAELNPLPSTCSFVCSNPCESECKRGLLMELGRPIDIRGLKRYVADRVKPHHKAFLKRYDKGVAVVGAGPAGITAAFDLAKKGYRVTVFEAGPKPGGMARKCIPGFRLNKDTLLEEINAIEEAGVEIVYNTRVGTNPSIDDLFKQYSAVIIAIGAAKGSMLPLEGMTYKPDRVYDAVTFMSRVNANAPVRVGQELPYKKYVDVNIGKNAIVIGAGSVAVDSARTLKRLGAETVKCVCVESEQAIPAPVAEVNEAKEEGIEFVCAAAPQRVISDFDKVRGIEFKKVKNLNVEANGKLNMTLVNGSEFTLDCDTIVVAVGQKPDLGQIAKRGNIELSENGYIKYEADTLATSRKGVFVAGDVVVARGAIVQAMASGRQAALSVDNYLQGRELTDKIKHDLKLAPQQEMIYRIHLEDVSPQTMPKARFRDGFDVVELGFSDQQALDEAARCMKCGFSVVDENRCIGCGTCQTVCPETTITLKKDDGKENN